MSLNIVNKNVTRKRPLGTQLKQTTPTLGWGPGEGSNLTFLFQPFGGYASARGEGVGPGQLEEMLRTLGRPPSHLPLTSQTLVPPTYQLDHV